MFVTEDAADGCHIAAELVHAFGQGKLPPVRVGLASGELVSVFGDLYGPEVNLAARLVSAANPGTAVVSETVRAAAGDAARFDGIPPLTLKGFGTEVLIDFDERTAEIVSDRSRRAAVMPAEDLANIFLITSGGFITASLIDPELARLCEPFPRTPDPRIRCRQPPPR